MIKIADSTDQLFQKAELCSIEHYGKKFCIGRHGGKVFAFQGKCPHAGADMSEGYVDAVGNVVCPLHHYKFSMQTGRNVSGEGYFMKCYPILELEDGVYLNL